MLVTYGFAAGAVGCLLLAARRAPFPGALRASSSQQFSQRIRREARRALRRRRKREKEFSKKIEHRDGCPARRIEFEMKATPDGARLESAHCLDCGEIVYRDEHGN